MIAPSSAPAPPTAHRPQAFVLAVSLTFQEVSHRDEFVKVWTPLAEYVQAEEHGTLSFELAVSDGDPCKVIVYER